MRGVNVDTIPSNYEFGEFTLDVTGGCIGKAGATGGGFYRNVYYTIEDWSSILRCPSPSKN